MTARLDLVGVCKQIISIQQSEVPQKCIFLMFGDIADIGFAAFLAVAWLRKVAGN